MLERYALASILIFWCPTSQCEVPSGRWVDAEGLQKLARQGTSFRCAACGQQHPVKDAYLKPHPQAIVARLLTRRRKKVLSDTLLAGRPQSARHFRKI